MAALELHPASASSVVWWRSTSRPLSPAGSALPQFLTYNALVPTKIVPCTECSGTGETIEETTCRACDGTGLQTVAEPLQTSLPAIERPSLPTPTAWRRNWWAGATILLVALILASVGALLAYLIPRGPG